MLATGGLYAPTIRYNNGTFYVVCTNVIRNATDESKDELQNFIVSTSDIYSDKWSDPVKFDFYGIDTSLFFDVDAKAYICGSKSPGPKTRIMLFEIDLITGAKITKEMELWNGTGGIYPEGPHIYHREGFYYLMIAEGGTHEDHSVTMARSRNIQGPYEPSPENPILSAAGTDEYVQCTGHCEAFEDKSGEWWGVCLAIRMVEDQLYGLGRETFLTKGHWTTDGWLKFDRVKTHLRVPGAHLKVDGRLDASPGSDLLYIRDPLFSRYVSPSGSKNSLDHYELDASANDITSSELSPTFIGKRQRLLDGVSSVVLKSIEARTNTTVVNAGLVLYKDEHRFLRIFHSTPAHKVVFQIVNKAKLIERSVEAQLESSAGVIKFTIVYTEKEYRAYFSIGDEKAIELGKADALELSGKDFVGPIVGLFAFGQDDNAGRARFEEFVVDSAHAR